MISILLEIGGPDLILRGEDRDIDLVIRVDDAVPSITSATLTLYDANGTARVTTRACTIPEAGRLRCALVAADTTDLAYALGWRGVWVVTIAGVEHRITRDYALVMYAPPCPLTSEDLYAMHPTLRDELPPGQASWGPQIRSAWVSYTQWLFDQGKRHWLIRTIGSPQNVVRFSALALIYSDSTSANARYAVLAKDYETKAENARTGMRFEYDRDEDGVAEAAAAASPVVFLSCGPRARTLVYP